MKDNRNILSTTQTQFIDYVKGNLSKSNRIILYKHEGHFGLEYAMKSRFNNIEILNLEQLKMKTGKNILFRLVNIVAAIVAFILNEHKDIDARTTVSTILSNMENIYLGIDKEKEYLKYLHIKKFPCKSAKIHFAIRIDVKDIETEEDMQSLKLLCKLIKSWKISNTILLISGEKINLLSLGLQEEVTRIPVFKLQENDLILIARKNNIKITESIFQNIDIIQKLGLQFFLDNSGFFDALDQIPAEKFDWIQKMDWIVNQMIRKSDITNKQLYRLLEFSSFFDKYFTKIEIQNFNNDQLEAQNLNKANDLAIISQEKSSSYNIPTYSFKLDTFKMYFAKKYFFDLEPMPKMIFQYFRTNYPFVYIPALRVLQVDSSFVEHKEKQSLIIIAYYYQNIEKGACKYSDFISLVTKDSTAAMIIRLYEYFKKRIQNNEYVSELLNIVKKLKTNSLDTISTCAGYTLILQFLKENYILFPEISYSAILQDFLSAILDIENINNYNKYWKVCFMCQYIALSLEDESASKSSAKKFLNDINNIREEENFSVYIEENHLRGFSRMDLLSYSLGYDNAGEILRSLYLQSEESTILKELSRINYSSYLIENELFSEAEKLLKKGSAEFLSNINVDTYCSYFNNLYLAQWRNKTIDTEKYIKFIEKLIQENISYSDRLIIQNNLYTAYLMSGIDEKIGIEKLKESSINGNPYNRFFATHNLLSFFFVKNDKENFNCIYNKIFVPKLLLSDKTFFLTKFKWMKEHIGLKTYDDFKSNLQVTACYKRLFLMGTIERWFE